MADYYELLGVDRSASADEIKRRIGAEHEICIPANPDDPQAEDRFKELAVAYQVLSDDDQRARYDRFGEAGVGGAGGPSAEDIFGGGGLGDIFDAFFGGSSPFGGGDGRGGPAEAATGQDMEVVLDLEFEQAVFGAEVSVDLRLPQRCDDCAGTGAGEGTQPVTCADAMVPAKCAVFDKACSVR